MLRTLSLPACILLFVLLSGCSGSRTRSGGGGGGGGGDDSAAAADDDDLADDDDAGDDDDDAGDDDDADDDDADDDDTLPDEIPSSWFNGISGSVVEFRTYTSGVLDGVECQLPGSVEGSVFPSNSEDSCEFCDLTVDIPSVLSSSEDCPGQLQMPKQQLVGLVLRQSEAQADVWLDAGLFGPNWQPAESLDLVRDDAEQLMALSSLSFEVGSGWGTVVVSDPCDFSDPCRWESVVLIELDLHFASP